MPHRHGKGNLAITGEESGGADQAGVWLGSIKCAMGVHVAELL